MNLLELRKYAIDHRVEIKFSDSHGGHECVISERGLVNIPGEDKDCRIEDVLEGAQGFEIVGQTGAQKLTREALSKIVAQSFERPGANHSAEEDE